jgi:hypothetical protein
MARSADKLSKSYNSFKIKALSRFENPARDLLQ